MAFPYVGGVILVGVGVAIGAATTLVLRGNTQPIEETTFLNFDPETTGREVLVEGWSGYEHDANNDSFVWCASQQCTLNVVAHGNKDRRVSLRLWAFRFPHAPPQAIVANVNGAVVATLDLKDDTVAWEFQVSKSYWHEGKNTLRFDFNYAHSPSGHIDGTTDPRTLAAAFDWLEILPVR